MTTTELDRINSIAQKIKKYLIDKGIPEDNISVLTRSQNFGNNVVDDIRVKDHLGVICESYRIEPPRGDIQVSDSHLVFKASVQGDTLKLDAEEDFCVTSVGDYLQKIEKCHYPDSGITNFYRGHSNLSYLNIPKIYRPVPGMSGVRYVEKESVLFKQAVLECSSDFPISMPTFDMLAKMRHFELPTRLLDLSKNPLVGLFFAAQSNYDKDGEVLIYKIPKKDIYYYNSDTVCILANIAKQKDDDFEIPNLPCETEQEIELFNKSKAMGYLLHDIRTERMEFYPIIRKSDMQSVICVMPRKNTERIQAQDGAFFIYGIAGKKADCAINKYVPTRLVIKADKKQKIISELKHLSIDEPHLFPSLDKRLIHITNNFLEY